MIQVVFCVINLTMLSFFSLPNGLKMSVVLPYEYLAQVFSILMHIPLFNLLMMHPTTYHQEKYQKAEPCKYCLMSVSGITCSCWIRNYTPVYFTLILYDWFITWYKLLYLPTSGTWRFLCFCMLVIVWYQLIVHICYSRGYKEHCFALISEIEKFYILSSHFWISFCEFLKHWLCLFFY